VNGILLEQYFNYSFSLTQEEKDLRESLMDWLPDNIIDCHVHCNLPEHVKFIGEMVMNHMMTTFPYFTLEQSQHLDELLFPGKNVSKLRFSHVFSGIDHNSANSYLLQSSFKKDRNAIFYNTAKTVYNFSYR
jgi:hypothetical protein